MTKNTTKEIGEKIQKARKNKKMSRFKLAELVGVHETTVKRYEEATIKAFDIEKLKEFAKALDIPFMELINTQQLTSNSSFSLPKEDNPYISHQKFNQNIIEIFEKLTVVNDEVNGINKIDEIINPFITPKVVNGELLHNMEVYSYDQSINYLITHIIGVQISDNSLDGVTTLGYYALIDFFADYQEPTPGDYVAISIDNEFIIIRSFYKIGDNLIILKPDSQHSEFKTLVFENEDIQKIKFIGRVIGFVSPFLRPKKLF